MEVLRNVRSFGIPVVNAVSLDVSLVGAGGHGAKRDGGKGHIWQ